jgi:arylsulfatase A-like enzyme
MPTHLMLILTSCLVGLHVAAQSIVRPNVLFIVVDDLNDWVGPLGGHPQSKTPNIDALAKRGTLFSNAHAQAPVCNPSRVSLLMGLRPSSSGVHDNTDAMEQSPALTDLASLPEWLSQKGYVTKGCGKVFHASSGEERFDQYGPSGGQGPLPRKRLLMTNEASGSRLWDLEAIPVKKLNTTM